MCVQNIKLEQQQIAKNFMCGSATVNADLI